jgi:hypothetical protein
MGEGDDVLIVWGLLGFRLLRFAQDDPDEAKAAVCLIDITWATS